MNIFVLDLNHAENAKAHVDKHCVKMILEYTQLLSNAFKPEDAPYKHTHLKHPCSIWASKSLDNWYWLAELAIELCREYTYRYGKRHKCQDVIEGMIARSLNIPSVGITEFAQAMPDEFKRSDAVQAYRAYYAGAKAELKAYRNRQVPAWWNC